MEIGTNVVRLSGGLLANKNRQGFRNFHVKILIIPKNP